MTTVRPRALLLVAAALIAVTLQQMPYTAHAATPSAATGTFSNAPATNVVLRFADGNTIITDTATSDLTGTFSGSSVLEERTVVHPNGQFTGHAVETFTGTVDGRTGTATFVDVVFGDATSVHGHFVVISGTGDLADLHGEGTFSGSSTTGAGTYVGQIHFGH